MLTRQECARWYCVCFTWTFVWALLFQSHLRDTSGASRQPSILLVGSIHLYTAKRTEKSNKLDSILATGHHVDFKAVAVMTPEKRTQQMQIDGISMISVGEKIGSLCTGVGQKRSRNIFAVLRFPRLVERSICLYGRKMKMK